MKCPACGKRLYQIQRGLNEYACYNTECPALVNDYAPPEWYGTQEEINELWAAIKP